ncbi:GLUG motif-containing protein [Murimonas intestini]|uniref:GLUG motif-containing protein n=1 Tax=Murimonas intestini TaxID=1337051 RepID=UPI0011DD87C7|nr:GLUG motif-containing protein [Murimonas intestini]
MKASSATEQYAGGIVGYNSGTVEDCRTDVDTSAVNGETLLQTAVVWGGTGSYVGGIAGYNNGTIKSKSMQGITVVAAGKNYVGGIVGYNDVKAEITDYKVTGGYISGDCFVSGYAGLNASEHFFEKDRIASPNLVKGGWYVGGIAGANLVPSQSDLTLKCDTDNFLGSINATGAFTGGFIGINALLPATTLDSDMESLREGLEKAAESVNLKEGTGKALEEVNSFGTSGNKMYIIGGSSSESITSGKSELNQITGTVYTAGIVAYSSKNTELYINNITNKTRVLASGLIDDKGDELKFGDDKTYSFAGGIIGVAENNVTLTACSNKDSGEVTGKGTYLGGLVEVNYGKVKNCDAGNFGENTRSYVGGIVGVNGETGEISGCSVSGIITGKDNVGGLVSENYGKLKSEGGKNCILTGSVRGMGSNVGGLVGSNMKGGAIENVKSSGTVEGRGTNVGGFVGRNAGSLSDGLKNEGELVSGEANVGGLVGLQEGTEKLESLENFAKVIAQNGDAGGIIGTSTGGGYEMFLCFNHGSVNAVKSGNVGGIMSTNSEGGLIWKSANYGTLTAGTGDIGGITAVNNGTLQNCNIISESSDKVVILGSANIGGMTAVNNGRVEGSAVRKLNIYNRGGMGAIGGYAGINNGTLEMSFGSASDVNIYAYTDGTSAGGVAGINKGTIGNEEYYTYGQMCQIIVSIQSGDKIQDNVQANMGGIAGINEGEIYGMIFSGSITGNSSQKYGMGGIAGINGTSGGVAASIHDCDLYTDVSKAGAILDIEAGGELSSISNVGGTAGINYQNATISKVEVKYGEIKSKVGYIGGISGSNYGTVTECRLSGTEKSKVEAFSGNIGGLVGINYGTGKVNNSSVGTAWTINATGNSAGDHAMGGCIGYNESGEDIFGLVNEAAVTKTPKGYDENNCHSVAGIIGRQEVKISSTWEIYDCENKGAVSGYARAGGIIGQWKYKGGTVRDCTNTGDISTSGGIAGGILGRFFAMDAGESAVIRNTVNHGAVSATGFVAGIIGDSRGSSNLSVNVVDSVNTGKIKAKSSNSTSAGIVDFKQSGKFTILRCRNYGHSVSPRFSGIVSDVNNDTSPDVNYCFGIASGSVYPIAAANTLSNKSGNNYYFGEDGVMEEPEEKLRIASVAVNGFSNDGDTSALYDGILENKWTGTSGGGSQKDASIELVFEAPIQLSDINIYWGIEGNTQGKPVTYNYSLKYREEITGEERVIVDKAEVTVNPNEESVMVAHSLENPAKTATVVLELLSVVSDGKDYNKVSINEIEMLGSSGGTQILSAVSGEARAVYSQAKGEGEELKVQEKGENDYTAFSEDRSVIIRNMPLNPNRDPYKSNADLSQEVYNGLDTLIMEQYYQKVFGNSPLDNPSEINGENIGGAYKITWKGDPDAYSTEIYARIYDSIDADTPSAETVIYVTGQTTAFLSIREEWIGKYLGLSVKSKSMSPQPGYDSEEIFANQRYELTAVLPTPEVSFQLTAEEKNEVTYTCVLENAEEYGTDQEYFIKVKSPFIKYENSNEITFSSLTGVFEGVLPVSSSLNSDVNTISAQAKSSNGKSLSRTSTGQTQILWKDKLKENDAYVTFSGFKGVAEDTLEYYMTMGCINSKQLTYRAEYLVYDEILGIWVSRSAAETYVSSGMTGKAVTLKNLPLLPTDMKNIKVRTYPWSSQNDLVKYAYYLARNIEADSIEGLIQAVPEAFAGESEADRLKAGYDVEQNVDGTYNIIYSLLLESPTFANQVKTKTFVENPGRVDSPIIADTYGYEKGWYTFSWDNGTEAAGPYAVKLYGYALDDTEVLVYSQNEVADKQVEVDGSTWKYKRLRLVVTRKGILSGDYVSKLYNSAEVSYDVRLPLDTVDRPGSPQLDEETGKNELIYRITWNGINDEGQLADLKGYSVYATDGTDIQLLAEVTADVDTGSIPTEALIDLDGYEGGIKLSFYIIANAKPDSLLYQDSSTGVMRDFTVPTRLEKPADVAVLTPGYTREDGTMEDGIAAVVFESAGLTVSVPNTDNGIKFVMKAAVYDSPGMNEETGEPLGIRLTDIISDSGLDILSMANNGSSAQYTITGLSRAYAGQYLFLQFRRTSDSAISSKWSDYQWVRLPRVRLDEPQLSQGTVSDTLLEKQNSSAGEIEKEVIVSRPFIEWAQDGLTKNYNIWMKFLGADESMKYPVKLEYINETTFHVTIKETEMDENGNYVIVDKTYEMQPEVTDEQNVNIYSFELKDFSADYNGETEPGTAYSINVPARIQAVVHKRADTGTMEYISYRILLPDMEELHDVKMLRTSYAAVQGTAETDEFYTSSLWEEWVRVQTDQNEIKTNTTVFRNVDSDDKFIVKQTGENYFFMNAAYDENLQESTEEPSSETETETEQTEETSAETEQNQTETSDQTETGGQTEENSQTEESQPSTEPGNENIGPTTEAATEAQTESGTEPPSETNTPVTDGTEAVSVQTESEQQPAPVDETGDGGLSGTEGTT